MAVSFVVLICKQVNRMNGDFGMLFGQHMYM